MAGRERAVPHIYIYIIYILHIYFFPQSACMSPSSSIYFTAFISYFGQMPLCQVCSRGPGVSSPHSAARHEPPSDPGRHPPLCLPSYDPSALLTGPQHPTRSSAHRANVSTFLPVRSRVCHSQTPSPHSVPPTVAPQCRFPGSSTRRRYAAWTLRLALRQGWVLQQGKHKLLGLPKPVFSPESHDRRCKDSAPRLTS